MVHNFPICIQKEYDHRREDGGDITDNFICHLIETKYNLGKVESIQRIPSTQPHIKINVLVYFKYWYANEFTHFLQNELNKHGIYNLYYFFEDGFTTKNGDNMCNKLYICTAETNANKLRDGYIGTNTNKHGMSNIAPSLSNNYAPTTPPPTPLRNTSTKISQQIYYSPTNELPMAHKHPEYVETSVYNAYVKKTDELIDKQHKMVHLLQTQINGLRTLLDEMGNK